MSREFTMASAMMRPIRPATAFLFFTIFLGAMPGAACAQPLRRAGYLGVQVSPAPVTGPVRAKGVVIDAVFPGGSAQEAGLEPEDLVTRVDGRDVEDREEFARIVRKLRAGDAIRVEGRRATGPFALSITVKARAPEVAAGMEVSYESVAVDGHRRRTLVAVPAEASGKRPAVLFVTGVGCFSQEILDPNDGVARFLHGLTRAGFLTMRVEKPSMGDSEGPACASPEADLDSEVRGYVAGLRALRKDPRVDPDNVFVVGLSMGGIEAPLIAAAEPVKGVVVINTAAKPFFEYLLETRRRQLQLGKTPFDEMDKALALSTTCSYRLLIEKRTPDEILKSAPECAEHIRFPAPYTYMQQWAALNMGAAWKAVAAPVLIVVGTSDYIAGVFDSPYLSELINSYQPGRATLTLVNGMDHYLTRAPSMRESFTRTGKGEFEPAVLDAVVEWLRQHIRSREGA